MYTQSSRRQFLLGSVSGLSSAWLALRWPAIVAAQEHAQRAAQSSPAKFQFFSSQDAVEVEAIAAQVIPGDFRLTDAISMRRVYWSVLRSYA